MFCNNKMCDQHVKILYGTSMRIEKDGKMIEYKRYKYRTRSGKTVYFCSVCHEAIRDLLS